MKTVDIRTTIITLAIATMAASAHALPAPQVLRVDAGRADRGRAVTTDSIGNAYVAGSIERGRSEFAVVKYDSRGARVWEAHHSGSAGGPSGEARSAAVDASGNVFAAGLVRTTVGNTTAVSALLVKFTADGAEEWVRRVGSGVASHAAVDGSGNVYVGGTVLGNLGDWVTQKYTGDGTLLWERRYNGTLGNNDALMGLALDTAGSVVVVGWTDSADAERGATDIATVKYDAQGNTLWERVFTTTVASDEKPFDLAIDGAGNVYVTGVASFDTSGELPVTALTLAYDNQGTLRFRQSLGGQAVATGTAGELIVTGMTSPDGPINSVCPPLAHVARLDASGAAMWTTCIAGTPKDVSLSSLGEIFVVAGNYLTLQLDSSGTIVGQHQLNGSGRDDAADAHVDVFGNLYVTGTSFANVLSTSADMVTLKFAEGAAPPPAGTTPVTPSQLSASADARTVTLRWIDNSNNENGFQIERCQGAQCTNFALVGQVNANQATFLDSGRRANTRYRYRVRAFNDAGNSAHSNVASVQTLRR